MAKTAERVELNYAVALAASQMFRKPLCGCALIAINLQQPQPLNLKKSALFITAYVRDEAYV